MEHKDGASPAKASGTLARERRRAASGASLDIKALRLAVHGWWLGNPLVYKPGIADPRTVAHELAGAGAASGTLVVSDAAPTGGAAIGAALVRRDRARAVLLLRTTLPRSLLGMAAALVAAEAVQATLGHPCAVRWPWDVVLQREETAAPLCSLARIMIAPDEGAALLDLRLAFGRMLAVHGNGAAPTALLARPDWREVLLARLLHLLDGRLRTLMAECVEEAAAAREALRREWAARVLVPARAVVIGQDGSQSAGRPLGLTDSGALRLRGADGARQTIGLEAVDTACGWGRVSEARCAP